LERIIDSIDSIVEASNDLHGISGCLYLMLFTSEEKDTYTSAALMHIFRQLELIEENINSAVEILEQRLEEKNASA